MGSLLLAKGRVGETHMGHSRSPTTIYIHLLYIKVILLKGTIQWFFKIYWNAVDLQCWVRCRWTAEWFISLSSVAQSCSTLCDPWTAARQASLSITNSRSLPKLMSIKSVMPSSHLILCHPLLLLPSIFPNIRVFSNESALWIRWPKYQSFSFNIGPSNEHPGLISFKMDWLDLLAVHIHVFILPRFFSHLGY